MTVDWAKPIRMRKGNRARLIHIEQGPSEYPVLCSLESDFGDNDYLAFRSMDGRSLNGDAGFDIVNAKARVEGWIVVEKDGRPPVPGLYFIHPTKEEASENMHQDDNVVYVQVMGEYEE